VSIQSLKMTLIVACGLPAFPDAAPLYPGYGVVVRHRLLDQGLDISLASKLVQLWDLSERARTRMVGVVDASPDAASLYPGYGLGVGHWLLADGSKFEFIACKQARTVVKFVGACSHENGWCGRCFPGCRFSVSRLRFVGGIGWWIKVWVYRLQASSYSCEICRSVLAREWDGLLQGFSLLSFDQGRTLIR